MLTYLPLELNENYCIVFSNHDVVRVYNSVPTVNTPVEYTDYYITDHYTFVTGTDMLDTPVVCSSISNFTNNVFYRYDLSDILLSFTCIFLVSIILIYFGLRCFFRGLFK